MKKLVVMTATSAEMTATLKQTEKKLKETEEEYICRIRRDLVKANFYFYFY